MRGEHRVFAEDSMMEQLRAIFCHVVRPHHDADHGAGFIEFLHIMRTWAGWQQVLLEV